MKGKSIKRISRTQRDLINSLKEHLELLQEYTKKFKSGDSKYYKPIVTELRLLTHKSRKNIPLLIYLAQKNRVIPVIYRDVPPFKKSEITLNELLDSIFFASGTMKLSLTNKEFIAKASQQEGSAHEDLEHDFDYVLSKGDGLLIGNQPPHFRAAIGLAECIYSCGMRVLEQISRKDSIQ